MSDTLGFLEVRLCPGGAWYVGGTSNHPDIPHEATLGQAVGRAQVRERHRDEDNGFIWRRDVCPRYQWIEE
jgi:hypothetical protein